MYEENLFLRKVAVAPNTTRLKSSEFLRYEVMTGREKSIPLVYV